MTGQRSHPAPVRRLVYALAACAAGCLRPAAAFAGTSVVARPSGPFSSVDGKTDLAQAWIRYIFHGDILPLGLAPYAGPLSSAADGLRLALGIYSIGMLTLAALIVFYHIAAMVVETAHYGVAGGRRANQIWMPIRFVLAIGLLVPVSSSLSSGQYLVVKIAEQGSTLASNAWRMIVGASDGYLSSIVTPRSPDVAHLVATAVEMETCRQIYEQLYTPLEKDPVIHLAGNVGSVVKIPADRFVNETWRYSNSLHSAIPLCGEFRFSGYRRPLFSTTAPIDLTARMAEDLSNFAHAQTDDLVAQAHMTAGHAAPIFLDTNITVGVDIRDELAALEKTYSDRLDIERQVMSSAGSALAGQALADSASAGWLAAASFIPELVRLQESYSELVTHAMPDAQSPVLAHPVIARQVLTETIDTLPAFRLMDSSDFGRLMDFYARMSRITAQIHGWLYTSQTSDKAFIPPASADLRDRLNAATDPESVFSFFARALDASAMAHGVWGEDPASADAGYPFALIPYGTVYNPFASLVEFGRRQTDLAASLAGLAGSGVDVAGATGPSVMLGAASLAFLLGGLMLIFVVPLLPFLRFLMAALTWGLNLFEGVVAVPIVALAHLTPGGEGLSGGMARQAYVLWLGLMVRPLLTLFGFVLGILLFALSLAFIDAVLAPFARLALPSNGGLLVVANTGLVLLYDVLVYGAANASFKGIYWLPDQALRWLTSFVVADTGDVQAAANTMTASPGSSAITQYMTRSISGSGGGSTVVQGGTPGGGGISTASANAESHAMKMALFPSYGDGTAAGGGGTSSSSSHSSSSSTSHSSVNVTVSGISGSGGSTPAARIQPGKTDKLPASREKHESTAGGKDRTADDKDKIGE